jgi:4-amino-4-deoxy-L-arabinose transferase-like glycosyltransferase
MVVISRHREQAAITAIVACYLLLGILYAALTPAWQVPDEPAHFNYIRQLAAGRLPVIEPGDYDQETLTRLKSERFPADSPLAGIQYEDHQPPLYYMLAAPLYKLFGGALLPLRLFSVLLGAGVVVLAWAIGRRVTPGRPLIPLAAAGLVATIPQHVAMLAGVNNDSLAELLLALALLAAVDLMAADRPVRPWLVGLLLGAIFLTKSQAYIAAPVLGLAIVVRWRQRERNGGWLVRWLAGTFGPGLLIGGLWWARNLAVYGDLDWMGLAQHNLVVAGQPTTASWIATYGWGPTLRRFFQFTFQSFWGMFGWMGVVLDTRIYQALAVLTGTLALGFGLHLIRHRILWHRRAMAAAPWLLAFSAALTAGGYLWYNVTFVQHQGRYLFPALIPLSLGAGVALSELARPRAALIAAMTLIAAGIICLAAGALYLAAYCIGAGVIIQLSNILAPRGRWAFSAALILALAGLAVISLILFVIPALA